MSDIAGILNILFTLLTVAIIARALLSFIDPGMRFGISQILINVTEPIIAPIRRFVPPIGGGLDLSPLIALILLQVVERVILRSITS